MLMKSCVAATNTANGKSCKMIKGMVDASRCKAIGKVPAGAKETPSMKVQSAIKVPKILKLDTINSLPSTTFSGDTGWANKGCIL